MIEGDAKGLEIDVATAEVDDAEGTRSDGAVRVVDDEEGSGKRDELSVDVEKGTGNDGVPLMDDAEGTD